VRIFTRQGRGEISPHISLAGGTGKFAQLQASIGGELSSGLSLHLGAGHTSSGGFSAVRKEFVPTPFVFASTDSDDDESRNTHFSLRLSQRLNDSLKAGISALQNRADVDYDGMNSNHAEQILSSYSMFADVKLAGNWQSKLQIGRSSDELDNDLNGVAADYYHTRINQLHWENTLTVGQHVFRFGAEAQDQKLSSDQEYSKASRHAMSAYAGVGVKHGAHDLDASLRHDHYSDFGGHTTGRLAYGYAVTPALKLHGAVGTAFKAPTFNDLYLDFPPFYFANPNLSPEKSGNAEIGLSYAANRQWIQATLFASQTKDMIVIDPVTFATTVNLDEGRNRGLELAWNGKLAGMDARAALTLQNPEDASTGQALLRRAQRFGSFRLSDRIGKYGWLAELVASGPHPDIHVTNFTRVSVPGYADFNLSGDYYIARDWKLTGRVLNVLDTDYSLVHGYATPGRQVRLELAYTPK
jgi:vitamin B12 transporter